MMATNPPMSPRKDFSGDPLFDAALRANGPRSIQQNSTIILTEHQPRRPSDPSFDGLFSSATATCGGMHAYYSEFRLGHGDPLFKAAMKRWPCATTDYSSPQSPDSPLLREHARMKRLSRSPITMSSCRALSESVPRDLTVPTSSTMWPFVDIVELDHLNLEAAMVKERRFVMLDESGHTVAEADDDVEEIYSDF